LTKHTSTVVIRARSEGCCSIKKEDDEQSMASHTAEVMTKAPQGTKRAPADDLEGERRLAKRFDLMNLGK
jgi:hypothetical protein